MPYGEYTLAAGSMYSLDSLNCSHADPSLHLRSQRKEEISPRFMLNKQKSSVHGMEFNHTDVVTTTQVVKENLAFNQSILEHMAHHHR
jgi:hypothetical protein